MNKIVFKTDKLIIQQQKHWNPLFFFVFSGKDYSLGSCTDLHFLIFCSLSL